MMLESLNSAEFQQLTDDDSRAVLGGLAAASHTTRLPDCILNGQQVRDYETDPDVIIIIILPD